jgi:chorismate mutase/prephenate dehydratase
MDMDDKKQPVNDVADDAQKPKGRPLASVRQEIDRVDDEIVKLLNRRARISRRVGKLKAGEEETVFKPQREKALTERLLKQNAGPLPDEHLRAIYTEILSSSRSLQRPEVIAYLGPEGTFSYFAGLSALGRSGRYEPKADLEKVFAAVDSGEAKLGVIPLENSLQGAVGQSIDLFHRFDVHIQAEVFCRISHSLLSRAESLAEIDVVYSHSQALAQCGGWLRANLPRATVSPTESTAAAARSVIDDPRAAAIGHSRLADMFDLGVLAGPIEDLPDNWTRFMVIAKLAAVDGERQKTSLLFTTPNKPGALASVLSIFSDAGINMTKLESRPLSGEKWRYIFFADLNANLYADENKSVRKRLTENCHTVRLLGSYPEGEHLDMRKR